VAVLQVRRLFLLIVFIYGFFYGQIDAGAEGETGDGEPTVDEWVNDDQQNENSGENKAENPPPETTMKNTVWMFVKMVLALGFVIALIYFLLRFVNSRTKAIGDGKAIKSLGGVGVGSNRSVQLVKVGERIFVIGVGETVSLLKEISEPEEIEQMLEANQVDPIDGSFKKLKDFFKENTVKANSENPQNRTAFAKMLESQLKTMGRERKQAYEKRSKKESDK
jgi:flagellar protein FliO/FliZ